MEVKSPNSKGDITVFPEFSLELDLKQRMQYYYGILLQENFFGKFLYTSSSPLLLPPPPKKKRVKFLFAPGQQFLENLAPKQLYSTLIHSMCKILFTERHKRILAVKNSCFKKQTHNYIHLKYM